jgi:hypothetical protein
MSERMTEQNLEVIEGAAASSWRTCDPAQCIEDLCREIRACWKVSRVYGLSEGCQGPPYERTRPTPLPLLREAHFGAW